MKNVKKISFIISFLIALMISSESFSQDEKSSHFTAGADIYSSYIWRGTRYGSGPAIQPMLKFSTGPFTAGGWGSFDFNNYQEADLYFFFFLPAGLLLGMTDYYYPGLDYFDYSNATGSHAFEINLGFLKGGLGLSANYILNEAGNAGSDGGDIYIETKYTIGPLILFIGAGNGWYTVESSEESDSFTVCNLGFGILRTIKVTDSFSLPIIGQIVLNPDSEQFYIVVGITL